MRLTTVLLTLCTAAFICRVAEAETIFLGPTPYLSAADSPFDLSGLGTTFFLEDFEDGLLNTPGLVLQTEAFVAGTGGLLINSVDADDGVIDGSGVVGHNLKAMNPTCIPDTTICASDIRLAFDAEALGGLPSQVGLVWTNAIDGARGTFQAFGPEGDPLGTMQHFGTGDFEGTADDRFFGVVHQDGISGVRFSMRLNVLLDVDHVQYGAIVPEPDGLSMLAIGVLLLVASLPIRRRRRSNF